MNRLARLLFALIVAVMFAAPVILNASSVAAISCDPCPAVTTADLNLRSGPSLTDAVLRVIPFGAQVSYGLNQEVNGYVPVIYDGSEGWSSSAYLDTIPPNARVTTDWLNLRAGPSLDAAVITVMPPGSQVSLTGGAVDGFASVVYGDLSGYAHVDYLAVGEAPPPSGANATVSVDLNLRNGPSLSDTVLLVMPAGARVSATSSVSNGFVPVTYGSTDGWAYRDYLTLD